MTGTAATAQATKAELAKSAGLGPLDIRPVRCKLSDLRLLDGHENARYMKAAQFQQLVENLKADGVLTSTPLIHKGVIRSGNHRVQAALKAGIAEGWCLELVGDYPPARLLAIQLSHNAIAGEDDPSILATLWKALPFEEKRYSGLTDESIGKIQELDVKSLGIGGPAYEEMVLLFLPEDIGEFQAAAKRLEKKARQPPVLLGLRDDFEQFFSAVIAVKTKLNVHNTALAIKLMSQLALERLDEMGNTADQA